MEDCFTLSQFEFFVQRARTRFPFRYGIASMTEVPHLFVRTRVAAEGKSALGLTAEGLPPKWFTKNPATTFEQDLPDMLSVIRQAAKLAEQIAERPVSFFEFWRELYREQGRWAKSLSVPSLLASLGVSLAERAVLDGLCRLTNQPLHRLALANRLGIRLGEVYSELTNFAPRDLLPPEPLPACFARHTLGLGDALGPSDLPPEERVYDGLPQDLESSIRAYGLRYFKIKLSGNPAIDLPRLRALGRLLVRETGSDFFFTLDGNENFKEFQTWLEFWRQVCGEAELRLLRERILAIEQPVHRDCALKEQSTSVLRECREHPPLIIDESDGAVGDLTRALELGYSGTSHKNCKGIIKGLANACLLAKRRQEGKCGLLTGEDLCNLGPVALQQDLAMMALLGIEHVERNGHHYYRGLSMLPQDWQQAVLSAHADLYTQDSQGFARLQIQEGKLGLASVNQAPFGVRPLLEPSLFAVLDALDGL